MSGNKRRFRKLVIQPLECRRLLDGTGVDLSLARIDVCIHPKESTNPWNSGLVSSDADGDGVVSPMDVLSVINYINANGAGEIVDSINPPAAIDVNDDGFVSPDDALSIINEINQPGAETAMATAKAFLELEDPHLEWKLQGIRYDDVVDDQEYPVGLCSFVDRSDGDDDVIRVALVNLESGTAELVDPELFRAPLPVCPVC